jgi:hypothetical protein
VRLRPGVVALAVGSCIAGAGTAAAVASSQVGIVPPRQPAANCLGLEAVLADPLRAIDVCRGREGVGPMQLPSNWRRLTAVEQTFVAIDLERVNRGLKPLAGLDPTVDGLAQEGANAGEDPPFPEETSGVRAAGGVFADTGEPLPSIFLWMYDDGPGENDYNELCPPRGGGGCWGHRSVLLMRRPNLTAGGGHTTSATTFEILSLSRSSERRPLSVFSWSSELRFFARPPASEPKQG